MKYAVLTGDIIKSHKLSVKLSKVQELLKSIPEQFNKKYGKSIESNLDIFRGDSWQLILYQENLAIRLALFIKAYLLSEQNVRTRISIGIGTVDKIEKNNVSESFGKAFELSGKGLDNLDNQQELYLATEDIHMKVEIKFLDCIFKKITLRQASAVRYALLGCNQNEIAEKLERKMSNKNITQQAVAKLLKNSCWKAISDYLESYEQGKI